MPSACSLQKAQVKAPTASFFGETSYLANIKHMNRECSLVAALTNRANVLSFPETVSLTVLDGCNLDCRMCNQTHKSKNRISRKALDEILGILPFVKNMVITGGEPFLYPHLDELLQMGGQARCNTVIQTNGLLINQDRAAFILDNDVALLKISCDGATSKTYNTIRRGGNFHNLIKNIAQLQTMRMNRGRSLPRIILNFVAMKCNIKELPKLVLLAGDLGVSGIDVFPLRVDNEEMIPETLYFHQELYDEIAMKAQEFALSRGLNLILPPLFSECRNGVGSAPQNVTCHQPWTSTTINVNGSVAVCCGGAGTSGNLNEMSFIEAWNHSWRAKVRQTVNTENELECCRNCRLGKQDSLNIHSHIPDKALAEKALAMHA